MRQELVEKISPRLKSLSQGGYERAYRTGEKWEKSGTLQFVMDVLDSLGVNYERNVQVPGGGGLTADLRVNGNWVFVDRDSQDPRLRKLGKTRKNVIVINREALRSDTLDGGFRVLGLGQGGTFQTIFLDDPSFNFDYAHILPKTRKCSVMHGHTSSVLVEIVGRPIDGMVVDFGIAKEIVRSAVRGLDHKLFIMERYVTAIDRDSVELKFDTVHGAFAIRAPKSTTVLLHGEATVENLAREVLSRVAGKMPTNVTAVGVYVYEGLNKGSHLVAQIHQGEAQRVRKRR